MHDSLTRFHPLVQTWFAQQFEQPTGVQSAGWEAIAQGRHNCSGVTAS
jgi:Lhr-like helicase